MRFKFEITMRNDFCITEEDILDAIVECIGMEGKLRLLETELPFEEISIKEMNRISEMSKCQEKQ